MLRNIIFLTEKHVLSEKDLLEKAATIKAFEYLPLGSELKKQTGMSRKTVQKIRQHLRTSKID